MRTTHKNPVLISWDAEAGFYIVSTLWHDIYSVKTKESILELIDKLADLGKDIGTGPITLDAIIVATRNNNIEALRSVSREQELVLIEAFVQKHGGVYGAKPGQSGLPLKEVAPAKAAAKAKVAIDPNLLNDLLNSL